MAKNKPKEKMIKTSIDLTSDQYQFLKIKALERKMRGADPSFVTILRELIDADHKQWKAIPKLMILFILGLLCAVYSLPAAASYLPFNTSVNMNIGIGTATPQGAFVVTNGNVGIGTWAPVSALEVNGNIKFSGLGNSILGVNATAGSGNTLTIQAQTTTFVGQSGNNLYLFGGADQFGTGGSAYISGDNGGNTIIADLGTVAVGNVGIGTITPKNELDVIKNMVLGSSYAGIQTAPPNGLLVQGNVGIGSVNPGQILDVTGTVRTIGFTMSGQTPISGYVLTASDSSGDTTWSSPGSVGGWTISGNNVYETSSGNVGIGTTTVNQGALVVTNGNVGIGTWAPGGAFIVMNGNVGIGTIVPLARFVVAQVGTADAFNVDAGGNIGLRVDQFGNGYSENDVFAFDNTLGVNVFSNFNDTYITSGFGAGTSKNIIMKPFLNGNVGVGSLSPGQLLDVQGTVRASGNVGIGSSITDSSGSPRLTITSSTVEVNLQ